MKIAKFVELWKDGRPPGQQMEEWFLFLKFMSDFWKTNMIKYPIVVEIGIRRGRQKRFWHELGAVHLGVDISDKYGDPEIVGNSHDQVTFRRVQERLLAWRPGGKCDLLFIDGDHSYKGVRHDYFKYRVLCSGIVAVHDIHCIRRDVQVNRFWNRLREEARKQGLNETFVEFFRPHPPDNYGIGLIIKDFE